jgi:hypothetical protein
LLGAHCPSPDELAALQPGEGETGPGLPTNTPVPVALGLPTNTSVPLATNTAVPLVPGLPTNTPVPTATRTPLPTNTPVPTATKTPVPTATRTPVPTNTPVPTDTPETGSCSDITVAASGDAEFSITNDYSSDIVLTDVSISWPASNGKLIKITLNSPVIWSQPSGVSSPADVALSQSTDKRTIAQGATKRLAFQFENSPASSGYSVSVTFDVGCTRSASD